MTSCADWEGIYSERRHDSIWPWSDVVQLVHRHVPNPKGGIRVLELGFGAGANIPFFGALGADYYGIEGSEMAVRRAQERYPAMADQLVVGDFTENLRFPGPFDLVIDRSSLTHNETPAIRRALALVREVMDAEGLFVGVDWFSTRFAEMASGAETGDPYTRRDFREGKLADIAVAHFADEAHMRELFANFEIKYLEHKQTDVLVPAGGKGLAAFNIVAGRGSDCRASTG
jgi:Methyltransferase domain